MEISFLLVRLGYLRIISITNLREDDKACNVRLALLGEAEELLPPRPACTIIHGPLRNCVRSVLSQFITFETETTNDIWHHIWYMIYDIWYMNQHETIWDEMRREIELHTSVITTARDSRDMKAHLACLKSGPSEPHVPSVEGKQLTTSAFQVAQFQTSNYPTFCNVFQTSQLLECSPAEKPFGGKAWLVSGRKSWQTRHGLDMFNLRGLGACSFRGLGRSDGATYLPMVPTCSCHWSRKPSATICKVCKTLQRLAIRTSEHRTYLSFGTPKSYWLRHEILQLQQWNLA